jgi:4-amino-4-deoxy-L-arabinose transferase-like glycosyltransferase
VFSRKIAIARHAAQRLQKRRNECENDFRKAEFFVVILRRLSLVISSALLLVLSSFFFLFHLGSSSVSQASDEVVYVRVMQGVLHEGSFFPMKHGNLPFFEKPPLKFWLAAVFPYFLGENNLSFRLLDGLLGIASISLSIAIAWRIFGSFPGALIIGFLMLGTPEWVISHHSFRRAVLDGLLTTILLAASFFAWRGYQLIQSGLKARSVLCVFSLLCGFAALTKSIAGLVPIGIVVALLLCDRPGRAALLSHSLSLISGPLVFAGYVAVLALFGSRALQTFIGIEIIDRVTQGFTGHNSGDPLFYIHYVFVRGGVVPVVLLLVGTVSSLFFAIRDYRFRFIFAWGVLPIFIYSCASSKVPWYLNPFMPFMAMVAVFGTIEVLHRISNQVIVASLSAAILLLSGLPFYRAILRHITVVMNDNKILPIDRIVAEIQTNSAEIAIVANAISGRVAPIKGRFNVEGIYREILRFRSQSVDDPTGFSPLPGQYVFVRESHYERLPLGGMLVQQLPPLPPRKEGVSVVRY